MKRGFVPHADSLIAFECAARHGSFTRAAEELHLTQGAVSKQVRHLETRLGVELFKRVRQRIVLTDAGRLYLQDVRGAIEHLVAATRQVMSFAGNEDVLNLATLPSFGTRWLAPRLARFIEAVPTASFNIAVRLRPFDFAKEPFDLAIHYGDPVWAGAVAEPLERYSRINDRLLDGCESAYTAIADEFHSDAPDWEALVESGALEPELAIMLQ